jgi:hypothetical protein
MTYSDCEASPMPLIGKSKGQGGPSRSFPQWFTGTVELFREKSSPTQYFLLRCLFLDVDTSL